MINRTKLNDQMEEKGGAGKFFCSLMHPSYAKESKWTSFKDKGESNGRI